MHFVVSRWIFVVIIQHTKLLQSEMSFVKGGRHLVFVYGTLKRGEPNHHWLRWDTFDKIVILVWRKKTLKRLYSQIAKVKVFFRAFDFKFFDSIVAYSISSYEWYWKTQTNIIDDYCSSSENGWQEFQGEAVSKHRFPLVIASRQKQIQKIDVRRINRNTVSGTTFPISWTNLVVAIKWVLSRQNWFS